MSLPIDGDPVNIERRIAERFQRMVERQILQVQDAWHGGRDLALVRDQTHRHTGGFRGVLERTMVPRSTAYRWIELYEAYPEVSHVGHFSSITKAIEAARPRALKALPELCKVHDHEKQIASYGIKVALCVLCRRCGLVVRATDGRPAPGAPVRWWRGVKYRLFIDGWRATASIRGRLDRWLADPRRAERLAAIEADREAELEAVRVAVRQWCHQRGQRS